MKPFVWNKDKNDHLKNERGVSFEEVVFHIGHGDLLARLDHPNRAKYAHQQIFVVLIGANVYMVPFIEDRDKYFLKTIIPSRKLKREYIKERRKKHETD